MYASGRTTQTTMPEDVSVNKAFAKDEGETHELEEFTGKHLIVGLADHRGSFLPSEVPDGRQ